MAPSTGPVKLLVANKKVMETEKTWNKLEYPVFRGTDGVYFIDDEDEYDEVLHSMAGICKKPVTRIYYIDSDNDEVPIDSDVEFKEALKFIGERTDKGKFTTMKIETESGFKNGKKKTKKTKAKATPKVSESNVSKKPLKGIPKKVNSDSTPNIEPVASENLSKSDISKAWLENHLKQLKTELMTDLESLLEPYIAEQKRISSMITSLQAAQIEKRPSAHTNLKQQTESDHNYSASSNSKIIKSGMTKKDSVETQPEQEDEISFSEDEEGNNCGECRCAVCPIDDDENLSIYSGEISVTESESEPDQAPDDVIDVPLPSCFNVINPQGGFLSKSEQKNRNGKVSKSEINNCQGGTRQHSKENPGKKKLCDQRECSRKVSAKQVNNKSPKEQTRRTTIRQNRHEEKANDIHQSTEDELCKDGEESYGDNADEDGQDFVDYDDDDDDYDDDYDEENGDKNNSSSPSPASYQLHLNQPARQVSELNASRQEFVQATDKYQEEHKYSSSQEDPPAASQYTSQYNGLPMAYGTPRLAPINGPKLAYQTQTRQGFVNSKQPIQLSVLAQNSFGQESQQIRKNATQITYLQNAQQPISNLQPKSSPTAATIIAQHQQIVQAAQRAAYQAQQTQALCYAPTSPTQQQGSVNQTSAQGAKSAFQDTRPLAYQDDNVIFGSQSSRSNTSQGENPISHNLLNKTGAIPRSMQEAAHELKLWNEVDQVDVELRKWVKMCQYLMERPPKIIEDGERPKKFSPAAAAKTYQDLERVYQKFRKEVQLVSTQIDAQKQQKQQLQGSGQTLSEDPVIAILPEKLMQVISSTLNTTFNLLGHISKLGVMNPPSGPSDENKGTPLSNTASASSSSSTMEKPQPQISAAISPQISGIGHGRVGYTGQPYTYYYPAVQTLATDSAAGPSTSILVDTMGNQDSNLTYRMRPMGSYPPSWGQNVSSFTSPALSQTQTAMQQVTSQTQPQNQQQQSQVLLQNQFQLTQPQIRQLQQQVQPQLQQQIQMHQVQQLQQQIQPSTQMQPILQQQLQPQLQQIPREDGSRLESSYTLQMHDHSMAQDANNTTISILYPNLKPNTAGFCTKSYGPALNRN